MHTIETADGVFRTEGLVLHAVGCRLRFFALEAGFEADEWSTASGNTRFVCSPA